ncbi:MAG: dihydroorotate dehydrogenase catalytic subunit [Bryobacterales bacterium]|nr:dihydroorotate dehydrogenase catalytic subunit [Bryobacterales bacterium]
MSNSVAISGLQTTVCGIHFRNPVLTASGTFGYGIEFEKLCDLNDLGGIVVKGLSREPIHGNPPPRLWEASSGMINSIGLQNIGVRAFVADKLPLLRKYRTPVIANVFGYAAEDYVEVVQILNDADGLAACELNVSCPNTRHGGLAFGVDEVALGDLVSRVRAVARHPLIVKLSPNVAAIEPFARIAEQSGADAISLVNTFVSLALDARTRKARIGAGYGGLSGPAIKPIALRMVQQAAQAVKLPVIGIGGIASGEDAAEFLIAGASLVEVGTATFRDPAAPVKIARQLGNLLPGLGVQRVGELVGTVRLK